MCVVLKKIKMKHYIIFLYAVTCTFLFASSPSEGEDCCETSLIGSFESQSLTPSLHSRSSSRQTRALSVSGSSTSLDYSRPQSSQRMRLPMGRNFEFDLRSPLALLLQDLGKVIEGKRKPSIFFMRAYEEENPDILSNISKLAFCLKLAGLSVFLDTLGDDGGLAYGMSIDEFADNIMTSDFVMPFYTRAFYRRVTQRGTGLNNELVLLRTRLSRGNTDFFLPVIVEDFPMEQITHPCLQRYCGAKPIVNGVFNFDTLMNDILMNIYSQRFFSTHESKDRLLNVIHGYFSPPSSLTSIDNSPPTVQSTQSPFMLSLHTQPPHRDEMEDL